MTPGEGPPRLARRWLAAVAPPAERDVVLGELDELWRGRRDRDGARAAARWYRRQVAGFTLRAWRTRRTSNARTGEEGGMGGLRGVMADVRWAIRGLRRRPTYALVAVGTLALGIGANSAVLALASAHFLTPLPYDGPGELVLLWETDRGSDEVTTVSPGNYHAWRERSRTLADVAAYNVDAVTLSGAGVPERVPASLVTPHFFEVVGVAPMLGAGFDESAARAADGSLVILAHGLWVRRYGADPRIVGGTIRIDGRPHTVVGVLPADYRQPERSLSWQRPEVWRPLLLEGQREDFDSRFLRTVARLAPGASVEQAREEMAAMAAVMAQAHPEQNAGRAIQVWTLDDYLMGGARPVLLLLLAAGVVVLLIVCSNLANLTLARGRDRGRELAVRAALGSGRSRLVRQVLAEAVVLALAGAAVGAIALVVSADALQSVQERFFTSLVRADVDLRVIAGTAAVALLSGLLFGLPVALRVSSTDLRAGLVEGGERAGRGPGRTQDLLIVSQVAMATALVVVASLLTRSFNQIVGVPPGFEPEGRVAFEVTVPSVTHPSGEEVEAYFREVWREMGAVQGVTGVAMVSDLPFTTENRWTQLEVQGLPYDPANPPRSEVKTVMPGYFGVMGIPVVAGALPDDGWARHGGEIPVAVNERLAELFWPGADPLGRVMARRTTWPLQAPRSGAAGPYRVAAVVGNVLDDGFQGAPEPLFYVPWGAQPSRRMAFVLETSAGPVAPGAIRAALARVDPDIPAAELRTLDELLGATVVRPRAASLISAVFAVLALLVAAGGIYGVLSYLVQSRTREIGIRSALGASSQRILRVVVGHSGRLLAVGLVLGVIGAVVAGRALSAILFQVRPWDPASVGVAVLLLASVGALAAWLPARRATRVDPVTALRSE